MQTNFTTKATPAWSLPMTMGETRKCKICIESLKTRLKWQSGIGRCRIACNSIKDCIVTYDW